MPLPQYFNDPIGFAAKAFLTTLKKRTPSDEMDAVFISKNPFGSSDDFGLYVRIDEVLGDHGHKLRFVTTPELESFDVNNTTTTRRPPYNAGVIFLPALSFLAFRPDYDERVMIRFRIESQDNIRKFIEQLKAEIALG
ncbi:MAG: hypothetical protein CEN90_278 [Parcubacteria group bacterium Licking1014_17]|nr:MAG: hypothetical protein CEN90_278 [Parcubacteria group bacterium Licking1014_17]